MPERSSTRKRLSEPAARIIDDAPNAPPEPAARSEPQKNPHAAALGQLGGRKGGPARAMRLSAERRSEIAQKAAQTRWRNQVSDSTER